jgi:hypothetical protein
LLSADNRKLCYVIMPFSTHENITEDDWTSAFENLFKPIMESYGYRCERSSLSRGAIIEGIVNNLKNAFVVIADISGYNPNVIWELGVRHALSKRTILVRHKNFAGEKRMSNLSTYPVFTYGLDLSSANKFKTDISRAMRELANFPEKPDNPVFTYLKEQDLAISSYQRKIMIAKLSGLLTELIFNLSTTNLLKKRLSYPKGKKWIPFRRYSIQAMDDLLTSNYAPKVS